MQHVVQHVDVTSSVLVGEITIHFRFQRPVESLYHAGFQVFIFAPVKLYTSTFQHALKRRIQELCSLVALNHIGRTIDQYLLESVRNVLTALRSNGHRPCPLIKDVYTRQQISCTVIKCSEVRHVREIDLIKICDTFGLCLAAGKDNSSQFL